MKGFYCDHFVLPLPESHRFPMAKYRLLREQVVAEGIIAPADLIEPQAAAWDDLVLVHTQAYLQSIADGTVAPDVLRRIGFPWSPAMVERARRSVGGTIGAARVALEEGAAANLAGGTHHGFADRGEGYCVFNDVAVGARVLLREGLASRPAVVDCDVHQGNGTAAIFRDDPAVFTFSMHGSRNFPFHKETSDLDVTFEDGAGDDEYLDALEVHLRLVIDRHDPDFVFYVAGADPYQGDRLGRLRLTIAGLQERDRRVFAWCERHDLPVAVSMAGGYAQDVTAIVRIHANTILEASRLKATTSVRLPAPR